MILGGGGPPEHSQVFEKKALDHYLEWHANADFPDQDAKVAALREWLGATSAGTNRQKETSIESRFHDLVLERVLGYTLWPTSGKPATAYPKAPSRVTGIRKEPDLILGYFPPDSAEDDSRIDAVLELKSPGVSYDAPQNRDLTITPVQQAFEYGQTIMGVRWVLASNMRSFRLYSVDSPWAYESFSLPDCLDPQGGPTQEFRRLILLLHHDYLVRDGAESAVSRLHSQSAKGLLEIADGFYTVYSAIRMDLFAAVSQAAGSIIPTPSREEVVEATQRLLDRMTFLYYCEDHPDQLIPHDTVKSVTDAAGRLPGRSGTAVYHYLKALFREVDSGSPPESGVHLDGYNGELFKHHRVIDEIDLPDSLHTKKYEALEGGRESRIIRGVWGLWAYDFWRELDEHVLGRIFEESLSDLVALRKGTPVSLAERLEERKRTGIFYTTRILSDFLAASALPACLREMPGWKDSTEGSAASVLEAQSAALATLRVVDPACGSGAFLVSTYRYLLSEYWRTRTAVHSLDLTGKRRLRLDALAESLTQARLLKDCLKGIDLLPQATEIAKLALWLRSARKGEKVVDLTGNMVAGDTLDLEGPVAELGLRKDGVDLVIGNPPWGGELDPKLYAEILAHFSLPADTKLDSWEVFLRLGVELVRPGGRLALVLPDSLLYPDKKDTRKFLFENTRIEKVHYLGPDWFGPNIRMATLLLQARKGEPTRPNDRILALMLAGKANRDARAGEIPLAQLEAQYGRTLPASRSLLSPTYDIEVFRDEVDDAVIGQMDSNSTHLALLCERARGEEMSKAGLLWICPGCLNPTVPGRKRKGGGYDAKLCPSCNLTLTQASVRTTTLVVPFSEAVAGTASATFIDGDDLNRRFKAITPTKRIVLGVPGVDYKDPGIFVGPKLLIRKTGVGIVATLDEGDSHCPQTVFIYRLRPEFAKRGYRLEFVLGALLSRTMAYYVFKRFSEVDPAKAYPLLTHERLSRLPIPSVNFEDPESRAAHEQICADAKALLGGNVGLGGTEDLRIETCLRQLWRLSSDEGAYINGEFADLPEGQFIRDLFPSGRPKPQKARARRPLGPRG